MLARLGLCVALLLVMLQPSSIVAAQPLDDVFAHGRQLMRRGDYDAARDFYSGAAPTLAADTAPQALFLQARADQANGDFAAAEATLQSLFADYPETAITPSAMMLLAQVRRATGDCEGAVRALGVVMDSPAGKIYGPYPDLQRAMCLGRLGDFRGQLATAQQAMTIEGGGSRLTRIEILEEAAEASLKLGRRQDALNFYNQSLELAGSRAYRAEMLFTTATLARTLDQDELAMDRFRSVVIDYADTMRAAGALDALAEMGRHGVVSPLHAGTARLNAREYTAALGLFDQVGPEDPEWGAARFAYATTLMRMGREDEAQSALAQLADAGAEVGRALLQLGQLQERAGEFEQAEATYLRITSEAPERAPEAWYRAGFVRYMRNDRDGALAAFLAGLATGQETSPAVAAQLLYWAGRLLPVGSADAHGALAQAATLAPESYHGLRAAEALTGSLVVARNSAGLQVSAEEENERAAWLRNQGTSQERIAADLAALPGLRRADDLLALGMRAEASWEVDSVMRSYVDARDVAHLSGLADWLLQRDLPHLVLQVGRQERDLAGLLALPTAVQKQVFPLAGATWWRRTRFDTDLTRC